MYLEIEHARQTFKSPDGTEFQALGDVSLNIEKANSSVCSDLPDVEKPR